MAATGPAGGRAGLSLRFNASALCAHAAELTGLESWEGFEDRGNEWLKVRHPVGGGDNEEYSKRQRGDVLLELDAPVHGEQCVVLPTHALKKIAVLDTGPATAGDRSDGMAFEQRGEV